MNLFETLKQFKKIVPDEEFTDRSRRAVLASPQAGPLGTRLIFVRIFEAAGSLVLAGILIFAVVGGFSGISKYFSPVSFSGIDPAALHAEADAIDMQIELANLSYAENAQSSESTPATIKSNAPAVVDLAPVASSSSLVSNLTQINNTASGTPSSSISINEALEKLTQ